jgi:hypothetical protein
LTLTPTAFLGAAKCDLRGAAFRVTVFFATRRLVGAVFLATAFLVTLLLTEAFAFAAFLEVGFRATARLALGRLVLAPEARRLAADLGVDRRAVARDVGRLKPFVTALMEASSLKGLKWSQVLRRCAARLT